MTIYDKAQDVLARHRAALLAQERQMFNQQGPAPLWSFGPHYIQPYCPPLTKEQEKARVAAGKRAAREQAMTEHDQKTHAHAYLVNERKPEKACRGWRGHSFTQMPVTVANAENYSPVKTAISVLCKRCGLLYVTELWIPTVAK